MTNAIIIISPPEQWSLQLFSLFRPLNVYDDDETLQHVLQCIENVDKWGVDIFRIADLTANRPLAVITYTLLQVGDNKEAMRFYRATHMKCVARCILLYSVCLSACLSVTSR